MAQTQNSYRRDDSDNVLLKKILRVLQDEGIQTQGITINAGSVSIDGVEIKDDTTDTRAVVSTSAPGGSTAGLIVRNIPSGTQAVSVGDGSDVTQGAKADATADAATISGAPTTAASAIALLKGILVKSGSSDVTITNIDNSLSSIDTSTTSMDTTLTTISGKVDVQLSSLQNVGGFTKTIQITPTVSASPDYSIGDAVGGKQTLTSAARTSGGTVILESIQVIDKAAQNGALEILIFDSDPSAATITDNSAFVFSTDISKLVARISVATSDYVTINTIGIATLKGLGIAIKANGSANLYAAIVTPAALNLASTTDIRVDYGFLQD